MEQASLKIGNNTLNLIKSEDYIAIKANSNQKEKALSAIQSSRHLKLGPMQNWSNAS